MKTLGLLLLICISIYSCKTTNNLVTTSDNATAAVANDTVRIANEEVEYEILIIEPGFNFWLQSIARPEGYYTQQFLETRNILYVTAWNNRVLDPMRFDSNLYELQIDYNSSIDYGYEVNYKLYYYFIYFQLEYKQKLTGLTPRI
jgi:hypothetical protein